MVESTIASIIPTRAAARPATWSRPTTPATPTWPRSSPRGASHRIDLASAGHAAAGRGGASGSTQILLFRVRAEELAAIPDGATLMLRCGDESHAAAQAGRLNKSLIRQ